MFDVAGQDVLLLSVEDLRALVGRLCEAELRRLELRSQKNRSATAEPSGSMGGLSDEVLEVSDRFRSGGGRSDDEGVLRCCLDRKVA
jgi:hypothetical protein